ncbi:hypothetical protein BZF66_05880 [Salmonella enterica]|uniref:hypothetical protein n=1 Tax=Salmonella enterica TaxID=28901 RepID=UPI000FDF8877|nr:hypothetical protein CPT_Munch_018 [Salmonella phage Munch]EAR2661061.1 hypothetical protein [Salmonella enterica]ECV9083955.1 hypothetical protein [Salmonella enterica subsp. enterica serovar Infantis]MCP0435949.1 hypothetical protein [Salmonella enterica subsp. enterica serovar Mbandaka]EAZ2022822.1 hypothetical protein [Salmonella enterica]
MAQKITRENVEFYIGILNAKLEQMDAPLRYKMIPVAGGYELQKYKGDIQVDYCVSGQKLREVYEIVRFAANMISDNVK